MNNKRPATVKMMSAPSRCATSTRQLTTCRTAFLGVARTGRQNIVIVLH